MYRFIINEIFHVIYKLKKNTNNAFKKKTFLFFFNWFVDREKRFTFAPWCLVFKKCKVFLFIHKEILDTSFTLP